MVGMRIFLAAAALTFGAAVAGAQQTQDTTHKAGGVTAVAKGVSGASKDVGSTAKHGLKHVASQTHKVLKSTGRGIKSAAKQATGDTGKKDPNHKPGGLNKVARDVSGAVKQTGRDLKHGTKEASSGAHKAAKSTGRAVKGAVSGKDTTTH